MLNADGSGTRKIVGKIAKQDHQDGYGSAYYYFKQHGEELAASLTQIYGAEVEGAGEWLNITVDDSGSDWETVTLSFDFSSFEEYTQRLRALAYNETFALVPLPSALSISSPDTCTAVHAPSISTHTNAAKNIIHFFIFLFSYFESRKNPPDALSHEAIPVRSAPSNSFRHRPGFC